MPGTYNSLGSLLGPHIGQLRLAQIEFPLDSPPRFIFQLAECIQIIDLLPFGGDQKEVDLIAAASAGLVRARPR